MQKHVLSNGSILGGGFVLPVIRRAVRSWLAKRKLRRLESFDDYMLADIGLTRDDLRYGQALPSQKDPIAELSRIRDERIACGMRVR